MLCHFCGGPVKKSRNAISPIFVKIRSRRSHLSHFQALPFLFSSIWLLISFAQQEHRAPLTIVLFLIIMVMMMMMKTVLIAKMTIMMKRRPPPSSTSPEPAQAVRSASQQSGFVQASTYSSTSWAYLVLVNLRKTSQGKTLSFGIRQIPPPCTQFWKLFRF